MTAPLTEQQQTALADLRATAEHGVKMAAFTIDANPRSIRAVVELVDILLAERAEPLRFEIPLKNSTAPIQDGFGDAPLMVDTDAHDRAYKLGFRHATERVEGVLQDWEETATRVTPAFGPQSVSVEFACAKIREALG